MKRTIFIILMLTSFNSYSGIKEDIEQIMKLREEVESISLEVETFKKNNQAEIDVYIQRKQEVEASLLKEKFKADQLKEQIRLGKQRIEHLSKNNVNPKTENFLTKFWSQYGLALKSANPVISTKLNERLNKIIFDYNNKRISYEYALIQTWFILEDDIKISKEAEFTISPLSVSGQNYQAEMVRLGRNIAYIRTAEGKYAKLTSQPQVKLDFYTDQSSIENIENLIKQFKQQNKTGIYHLPGMNL